MQNSWQSPMDARISMGVKSVGATKSRSIKCLYFLVFWKRLKKPDKSLAFQFRLHIPWNHQDMSRDTDNFRASIDSPGGTEPGLVHQKLDECKHLQVQTNTRHQGVVTISFFSLCFLLKSHWFAHVARTGKLWAVCRFEYEEIYQPLDHTYLLSLNTSWMRPVFAVYNLPAIFEKWPSNSLDLRHLLGRVGTAHFKGSQPRALCSLLLDLQRNWDTVRCYALGMDVPGQCQCTVANHDCVFVKPNFLTLMINF